MATKGNLIDYGIYQEKTDYRCHVCLGEGYLYIYRTDAGIAACESGRYPELPARQPGVDGFTAKGYCVPPLDIEGCDRVRIPDNWLDIARAKAPQSASTTQKGAIATKLVRAMLRRGRIPVSLGSREVGNQQLQIEGCDIIVSANFRIQVKCDYPGGVGGTGRLYLQTAERNPLKRL